jgi:hypothetical protein
MSVKGFVFGGGSTLLFVEGGWQVAIGPRPQKPAAKSDVVVELPNVEVRSFDAYRIENLS